MCELIFAFALILVPISANANCATTASELGLQLLWSNGLAYQNPLLLRLYDRDGELRAEWIGSRFGLIGWSTQPELVIFSTSQWAQSYLVAGDPADGRLYVISPNIGTRRWLESPTEALYSTLHGKYREYLIRLPAPVYQPAWLVADGKVGGRLQVIDNTVQVEGRVLLDDHGLPHSLLESPSGRWVLAIEDQLSWTPIIYAVATDGSRRLRSVRTVDPAELPLERQQPAVTSPDGQWTVTFRRWPWGILLTHRNGEQRLYQGAPLGGPWWAPDSQRFAYSNGNSLFVVNVNDRSRETEQAGVYDGGEVTLSPTPRVFLGWIERSLAWLTIGSSDHGDYALPPNNWRETLE